MASIDRLRSLPPKEKREAKSGIETHGRNFIRGNRRLGILAIGIAIAVVVGVGSADVILSYHSGDSIGPGAPSPFRFVNGADYPTAAAEGFVTNTYPNGAQVSVSTTLNGADGAYGTYLLDVLEVQATATETNTWALNLAVSTPLVASGLNAAYLFYCSQAPTGVPITSPPLSSGTDANGNPWAIYPVSCPGTGGYVPLTSIANGPVTVTLNGIHAGTSVLYISFGLAVTNAGSVTTTPGAVTLLASSS